MTYSHQTLCVFISFFPVVSVSTSCTCGRFTSHLSSTERFPFIGTDQQPRRQRSRGTMEWRGEIQGRGAVIKSELSRSRENLQKSYLSLISRPGLIVPFPKCIIKNRSLLPISSIGNMMQVVLNLDQEESTQTRTPQCLSLQYFLFLFLPMRFFSGPLLIPMRGKEGKAKKIKIQGHTVNFLAIKRSQRLAERVHNILTAIFGLKLKYMTC